MAIEFVCPTCRETLRVADETAGRVVRCGACQSTLRVPVLPDEPDAPAPPARRPAEPVAPARDRDGDRRLDGWESPGRQETRRRRRRPPPRTGRGVVFWVLILFLLVGFLTAAACGGAFLLLQAKWRPHHSDRGGFRVELPADPRADMPELAKLHNQPNVNVEGTLLLGKMEEYSVVYTDVEPAGRGVPNDEVLKDAVDGLKKDTPGLEVLRDDPVTVSGFPAREVVFTHPEGGTYLCRVVVAGPRLYIATAGGPWVSAAGNVRVRRYLDSFQVTDPDLLKKQKDGGRPPARRPRRAPVEVD